MIDRIEILHTVEGQLRPTGVVRLGERIRIVAFYHDRRGAGRRALGTLVVSHSGHEIVQESMTGAIAGGQRTVNAAIALHSRSDVGPLVAQVAVISEGMTAQSSRRFVLQGH